MKVCDDDLEEFLENNREMLKKIKTGHYDDDLEAVGSFLHVIFDDKRVLKLFFDFLEVEFDVDYSDEYEYTARCWDKRHERYLKFMGKIESSPLGMLLRLMCD